MAATSGSSLGLGQVEKCGTGNERRQGRLRAGWAGMNRHGRGEAAGGRPSPKPQGDSLEAAWSLSGSLSGSSSLDALEHRVSLQLQLIHQAHVASHQDAPLLHDVHLVRPDVVQQPLQGRWGGKGGEGGASAQVCT